MYTSNYNRLTAGGDSIRALLESSEARKREKLDFTYRQLARSISKGFHER